MESIAKTLIIITLVYYLIKGLIYLMLWQTTYKIQEHALAKKKERQQKKALEEEIWAPDRDDGR